LQLIIKRTIGLVGRSPQISSLVAIFSLSVVGAAVTGFDLETIIRLSVVSTVGSVSGVFLLGHYGYEATQV